jgi:AcrR family transcriptional regulator
VLGEYGYPGATVREIAERAGVNPALVHHYFGTKRGLHAALLDRVTRELRDQIETSASAEGPPADRLRELMKTWVRAVGHDPYVPRLIIEEVLVPEGERLESFVEQFAAPLAERLLKVVAEGTRAGELRPVPIPFVLPSLAGLSFFVFVAAPLLRRIFGIEPTDPAVVEAWAEYVSDLLLFGIGSQKEGEG